VCKCLYCILAYIPSDICPGVISLDHIVGLFLVFLRMLHSALHSGCTNLHFHQQCIRVSVWPHPHQQFLLFVFLKITILRGVRWNPSAVFICVFFLFFGQGHWALLHIFIDHLYLFLWKFPFQFMCSLLHWVVDSLVV
jgi:hypothetical protein